MEGTETNGLKFFVENFKKILRKNKINFFTGVPDSILKNLSKYLENYPSQKHVIATNEGAAVSIGIGHYLSKKKFHVFIYKIQV